MKLDDLAKPDTSGLALSVALAAGAAMALAACGGAGESGPPEAFFRTETAPTRRTILQVDAVAAASRLPTATALLDWAERTYPQFFPDHQPDLLADPFIYRHYPGTGNYVGLAGNDVYVLGPVTGGGLVRVGALSDFAPLVLATRYAFTDEAAARFLLQAQVAARLEDIAAVRSQGYETWLDAQMALPMGERAWDWQVAQGYSAIDERALYDGPGVVALDYVLGYQLVNAPDGVRKRAALALSEMFVVSTLVAQLPWTHLAMAHYWDQLNANVFGNFRQLLEDLTLNPAMGAWLNTKGNLKEDPSIGRVPDENYAREVMQLFTIGLVQLELDGTPKRDAQGQTVPTYTQDDVSQLARVFTGYEFWDDGRRFIAPATNNGRPYPEFTRRAMVFDAAKHSSLAVEFLGTRIPVDTAGATALRVALDTLFNHPNVGPFFARQMIQRLVTSHPRPAHVARVAAKFNNNGTGVRGDLCAVWKAILLDDEARSAQGLTSAYYGKLREPMVRVFQWGRTFGARSRSGRWEWGFNTEDPLTWFGQRPLWSPSVFNFFRPGYVPPGTAIAAAGATAPEFQIVNESTASQWVNFIDGQNLVAGTDHFAQGDIGLDFANELPLAHDSSALVQHLSLVLSAGQISAQTRQRIVDVLNLTPVLTPASPAEFKRYRVIAAVTLVMSCAEYLVQK